MHADAILVHDRRRDRGRHWFLWVRCPACRTTNAIDLRTFDRHRDAPVTILIPALSCRFCRPNAPFAELSGERLPFWPTIVADVVTRLSISVSVRKRSSAMND